MVVGVVAAADILILLTNDPFVAFAVNIRNISVPIVPTPSDLVSPMFPVSVPKEVTGTKVNIGAVFCAIMFP